MKSKYFYFVFICSLLFFSCKSDDKTGSKAEHIIPYDSIVDIMVDIYLTDATLTTAVNTKKILPIDINRYYSDVLHKYHITKERFDYSIMHYCNDKESFLKIYDEILAELSTLQVTLQSKQIK